MEPLPQQDILALKPSLLYSFVPSKNLSTKCDIAYCPLNLCQTALIIHMARTKRRHASERRLNLQLFWTKVLIIVQRCEKESSRRRNWGNFWIIWSRTEDLNSMYSTIALSATDFIIISFVCLRNYAGLEPFLSVLKINYSKYFKLNKYLKGYP